MMKRDQYVIAGLLGVGALLVFWYLSRLSAASATIGGPSATMPSGAPGGVPQYPNTPNPIQMGDFEVAGSPITLTYNQLPGGQNSLPTLHIGAPSTGGTSAGCCDQCDAAGQPVNVMTISPVAIKAAYDNLRGFGSFSPGGAAPTAGKILN